VRALITDRQQPGSVFVPMHWTDQFASSGRVDALVAAKTDPHSGQPALKMSTVTAGPARMSHYGFAVSRERPSFSGLDYWAAAPTAGGHRIELAWAAPPESWDAWVREAFAISPDAPLLSVRDARSGRHNFALFDEEGLVLAVFVSPDPVLVSRQWAAGLLAAPAPDPARRAEILAGRPGADRPDGGAIVCACFSVGINTIVEAVTQGGCQTVEAVGAALKAGTNCGSCRAEIRAIINASRVAAE
jgi:assimilatory nitrate reductase catalytic subunit